MGAGDLSCQLTYKTKDFEKCEDKGAIEIDEIFRLFILPNYRQYRQMDLPDS